MDIINDAYFDAPKKVYRLDNAYHIESKTRQFPFVVAHEVVPDSNRSARPPPTPPETTKEASDLWLLTGVGARPPSSKAKDQKSKFSDEEEHDDDGPHLTREFLVFHDVEHFLHLRYLFPHSHEIIRCPSKFDADGEFQKKKYQDDLCRGRLIFDFDLKEPLPGLESRVHITDIRQLLQGLPSADGSDFQSSQFATSIKDPMLFVPHNFKELMEMLIVTVFDRYYVRMDTKKLVFIWQKSPSKTKFSMHLVVKHAFFSEFWVSQMRIFYILLEKIANEKNLGYLMQTVDFQIPRRNATFRMIGSSKIGGEALEIVACNNQGIDLLNSHGHVSVYDCLVNIYNPEGLKEEQSLTMDSIDYSLIEDEIQPSEDRVDTPQEKKFRDAIKKHVSILEETQLNLDLSDEDLNRAVEIFHKFNDDTFRIRDQVGDIINLDRCRKAACPLSGIVHEHENAYLKLRSDGHVHFCCRRGCKKNNYYGLNLGVFRAPKAETAGVVVNPVVTELAKTAKVVNNSIVTPGLTARETIRTSPPSKDYTKPKNSARRVALGTNTVQVPPELQVKSPKLLLVGRVK